MTHIPTTALVCKAVIEYSLHGETVANTLWFEKFDEIDWTSPSLETLLIALEEWLTDYHMPNLSVDLLVTRLYASRQENPTSFFAERFPTSLNGDALGDGLPANVAVSVKFASNLMGRSYRGRNFVPGIPEGDVTLGLISSGFKAALISSYGLLQTGVAAVLDANHVIVSKYNNGAPRALAVTVPVQSYAVRKAKVNTMRSRVN